MMIKPGLILLFCTVCRFIGMAQYNAEIDQLMKEVKEASYYDSTKLFKVGEEAIKKVSNSSYKGAVAEVYLYYGNYFYFTRNIDRSKLYLKRSIAEAKRTNNRHIEDLANIRLIFIDYEIGLKDQTEKDLRLLLEHSKKLKDDENTAELINMQGIMSEEKNNLQEAAKLYLEGLVFSELHSLPHYPAVFRNNLGLIKLYTNQTDDALIDFKKGLELATKESDKRLANHIEINMCLVYITQNKIKEALALFAGVLDYSRKNNHPRELASSFVNLGSAFINTDNPGMALSYMDSAINVLQNHSLDLELTKAYLGKAEVLISLKKNTEARESLEQARILADKTGSLEDKATYYLLLYRTDNADKKYKQALDNFLEYRKIKDSTEQIVNAKIIQGLQLKYNVQKKEVELEREKSKSLLLEKSNQEERYMKWFSIASAGLILIVLIGIITLKYSRKLREKQAHFSRQLIQKVEDERSRISRDLHDDIGQSLSIIKSQISTANREKNDLSGNLETELGRVIEQTREISKNLYPSYLEKIGLTRSVAQLMESIQAATKLECSFDITDKVESLPAGIQTHLYRIIQECTNNTIKHAEASALKISVTEAQDEFQFIYQDNGKGISSKKTAGMGLLSIRERAKIINGSVYLDEKSQKGFKLVLKFKATS